ncbi:MAG: DUF1592 domain-containing protein [Alphaproteobacteria bacterium]|nr:DUF1592 domain-containing protein [Alphaproteobacteria bacterium]
MRPDLRRSALLVALLAGCAEPADTGLPDPGPAPEITAPAPRLRRLTTTQYRNAVAALLGEGLVMPSRLEPDTQEAGLLSVGAGTTSVSPLGVERYESAALSLAEQLDAERLADLLPCTPASASDADCAAELVEVLGRRAWRRPLSPTEVDRLSGLVVDVGADAGSFDEGVRYAVAAMLQSPHFLYRVERGEPDPDNPGQRLLTDLELATRLSFLIWNAPPDDDLLDAAEQGLLSTDDGLETEALRLLWDDRAREGVRNLFDELLTLYTLADLEKDPTLFTHASEDIGELAREETLSVIEWLVVDEDADFRDLLTTQTTFVDPRLAALYGIAAPTPDGFGEVWLDSSGGRRGLLGQVSVLAQHAHATRSSATLRGKFVRTTLLCGVIAPPPADVDTSIPETDASAPTLRERIASHLEEPTCANCHAITDPIGLGLENFDGIGRWRTTENGATIDASGELDGVTWDTPWQLAGAVARHEDLGPCFTTHLYHYATGHALTDAEEPLRDWLAESFAYRSYSVRELVLTLALSPAFRQVGELE